MLKLSRIARAALVVIVAVTTIGADALLGQERPHPRARRTVMVDGREAVAGEVIVRYRARAGRSQRDRAEFQADSDPSEPIGRAGARRLRSRRASTRHMLATLRANPDVEFAEPNYIIRASSIPNDSSMSALWGLVNTGQSVDGQPGVPGADIGAAAAWDVTTGSRQTVVAILDTGIDLAHPDLQANIFTAPRAFTVNVGTLTVTCGAGSHGYSALDHSCAPVDESGHGTHVAGIIGAVGNNGIGVTGVNWTTTLLPLKVLGPDGTGTTTAAIEAIEWMLKAKAELGADMDVRVLNASWGGSGYSEALNQEIQAANNADILFVAAAGTDGHDNDATPHYPASSTSPNVLSVAASDNTGALAPFSNYGANSVHLAAPGASTLSTLLNNDYGYLSGTSMSAPFVAGAAALVLSACPSDTATLKATLLDSVDPDVSLAGKTISGGRLNVGNAIQRCRPSGDPSLTINNVSVTEGHTGTAVATFTVTLSPVNPSQTVTVDYATSNGTATAADNDYVAASGTLTFPPSTASRTISVTINGDHEVEPNETFTVALANATNAIIGDAQAIGTIVNDDAVGASITIATPNVTPGGTINFNVVNGPANRADWVAIVPASGADTAKLDWIYLNGSKTAPASGMANASLHFTAPSTPGAYNIRLFANDTYEKLATSATINVGSGPTLTIGDVSVTEGNSGTTTATFTVTLSPVNNSQTVTVNYATANGSASTADNDYVAASGTLTFAPSASSQSISVTVNGDTTPEANESFAVNLTGATNAILGDGQAIGTILNDDAAAGPSVTVTTPTVAPGGTITFNVANGPANPRDWVAIAASSAADTAKLDWVYLNGSKTPPASGMSNASLQFVAPSTPGTYNLRLFANDTYQKLATSGDLTVGSTSSGSTLSIGDVTVTEGNSGATTATFTVSLSPANTSQTVTVAYATANGTATAGSDYTAASGTLTFAPSVTTQTISVPVSGDTAIESNETFTVNLSSPVNATIADGQAAGTIVNDDAAAGPSVTVTTPTVAPGGTIGFDVSGAPGNMKDWVALYPVGAADMGGYVAWRYLNGMKNGSSTLPAPSTPGTYNIRLFTNDTYNKIATSGEISVASAPPQPTLTIGDVSVNEGNSGTTIATFTVTLSPVNSTQSVTVNYATANGTATTGDNDYVSANGTLTFAPSVATQTISVTINGNSVQEPDETFVVNLSGATNAAIGDGQATGTIVNDDGPTGPAINVATLTVPPGGVINFSVANGPANARDWVAIVDSSAADTAKLDWLYLNGSKSAPSSGVANASLQFTAPSTPGSYNIRLFTNDTYTKIATSANISVATGPTLTISDVSVMEGNAGIVNATFTVTLSPVNSTQTVSVDYATADGTATTANSDYTLTAGTLTFAPSASTATITVPITGDTTVESNETLFVNLSNAVNASIGDAQGVATIGNDDTPPGPAVTLSTTSATAGGAISFTVSGGPGNRTDWVGVYAEGTPDAGYQLAWTYLNGTKTAPSTGITNATLTLPVPTTPGTYNIRLLANDGFTRLAASTTFTVSP
jgi:subtilisin family serine protease/ribosomal protein L35AE/L33A